jgi:hypothetical protein
MKGYRKISVRPGLPERAAAQKKREKALEEYRAALEKALAQQQPGLSSVTGADAPDSKEGEHA